MLKKQGLEMVAAEAAYKMAEKSANLICVVFFYQPKLPDAVKRLRRNVTKKNIL